MTTGGYHGRFGALLGATVEFQLDPGGPVHVGVVDGSTHGVMCDKKGHKIDGLLVIIKNIRRKDGGLCGVASWCYENPRKLRVIMRESETVARNERRFPAGRARA